MSNLVKLRARPKLHKANMLAVWPGIGNVAAIIANYLLSKLELKDLGAVEAAYFFDPVGVLVRDNLVEAPTFPQSQFYYWKNKRGKPDLILFNGEDQPSAKAYELAHCVLDVGQRFQINRLYTCAAAMTRIHHTEPPRVWGVATSHLVAQDLKPYNLMQANNLQIAGLNGLLLGVAKERNIDGICLLGEVPLYATRVPNPMAAMAVMKVMTRMLEIDIDLADLARMAVEAAERMKQMAAMAMEEYIDNFTEPIWEREEDEEDEED